MKYKKANTGDSVQDMLIDMIEFNRISENLVKAKSFDSFQIWFSKCEEIDKRSLYIYLENNKDRIPEDYLNKVKNRFVLL